MSLNTFYKALTEFPCCLDTATDLIVARGGFRTKGRHILHHKYTVSSTSINLSTDCLSNFNSHFNSSVPFFDSPTFCAIACHYFIMQGNRIKYTLDDTDQSEDHSHQHSLVLYTSYCGLHHLVFPRVCHL